MKNKLELVLDKYKETVSSLELVKYLNELRETEYEHKKAKSLLTNAEVRRGKSVELKHKSFLEVIRDEFEEEINEQKILPVEYNVNFFYSNYSKLTNKVVGIENGTRDIISIQELFRVSTVEDVFNEIIRQGMEKDLNYKEIYQLCKNEFKKVFGVDLIE